MSTLIIGSSSKIGMSLIQLLEQAEEPVLSISRHAEVNPTFVHDVTDHSIPLPVFEEPLKGLIYLPGTIHLKPFSNTKLEQFQEDWHINFLSLVRSLQYYLPNLEKSAQASVVFISSVAAQTGLAYHASISASKAAIEGFARAIAAELAPKIRVNVIAPSLIESPLSHLILERSGQKELSEKRHPLHRIGQPEDVAKFAQFLLSDASSWITGQVHHIDGGLSSLHLF